MFRILAASLLTVVILTEVRTKHILFLSPLAIQSHLNAFVPIVKGVQNRGHQVTFISPKVHFQGLQNVTEISPLPFETFLKNFPIPIHGTNFWPFEHIQRACHEVFQNAEFRELMGAREFQLVIVNGFLNDCFYGYLHLLNVPFIVITPSLTPSYISETVGSFLPPSIVPVILTDFSDEMNIYERLINFMYSVVAQVFVDFKMLPDSEAIYRRYLGNSLPGIKDIIKNASLILTNSHFSVNNPRPLLPEVIEIGGIHCEHAKPLPSELHDILSKSEHGVIYINFGALINASAISPDLFNTILSAVSRLKYDVIWKYTLEINPAVTSNPIHKKVKLIEWAPQQDLLGHKKVKLFITHGGLLSFQEAIFHGVPIIGIPFGIDQKLNIRNAVDKGLGLKLSIPNLTEDSLERAILSVADNITYANRAKELSLIFRDRETSPLEKSLYWIEYVLRYNGTMHMRSGARLLTSFQYYSLDVMCFIFTAIISILFINCTMLYMILKKLKLCYKRGKESPTKVKDT